jgi:hypothetical protein
MEARTLVERSDLFWADPKTITNCMGKTGQTTLHWKLPDDRRMEIRVQSPDGPLFALVNKTGSKETGPWVKDGMVFYLVVEETSEVLATASITLRCR